MQAAYAGQLGHGLGRLRGEHLATFRMAFPPPLSPLLRQLQLGFGQSEVMDRNSFVVRLQRGIGLYPGELVALLGQ